MASTKRTCRYAMLSVVESEEKNYIQFRSNFHLFSRYTMCWCFEPVWYGGWFGMYHVLIRGLFLSWSPNVAHQKDASYFQCLTF